MHWLPLPRMATRDGFGKSINKDIDAHNAQVERIERLRVELMPLHDDMTGDVATFDFDAENNRRTLRVTALQEELTLRRKFEELEEQTHAALLQATDVAHQALEQAKADVLKRLQGIGYTDDCLARNPAFVASHPDVVKHRGDWQSYQNQANDRTLRQQNAGHLRQVEQRLQDMRRAALAV